MSSAVCLLFCRGQTNQSAVDDFTLIATRARRTGETRPRYEIKSNMSGRHHHGNVLLTALAVGALVTCCFLCARRDLTKGDVQDGATVADDQQLVDGFTRGYEIRPAVIDGLPYRYTPPTSTGINLTGTDFLVDAGLVKALALPPSEYFELSERTVRDFVFVTAADDGHYGESKDCVASVQRYFPGYEIFYYDLGLTADQRNDVSSWCNVKVRDFAFDVYPEHVKNKETKCFKFLIIQEALREHRAIFWVDASFRAKAPIDEFQGYFDKVLRTGGVLLGRNKHSVLSNVGWTDPVMYQFLVSDTIRQRDVGQVESGAMLLYNTRFAFTRVLWWLYLCSLDGRCCPPQRRPQPVDFDAQTALEQRGTFHEHRHDQSAINIVMANLFDYNTKTYAVVEKRHTHQREETHNFVLDRCPEKGN